MESLKINGVWFRGQFGEALISFLRGEVITMGDFYSGKIEPTSKIRSFVERLDEAGITYKKEGKSLRQLEIRRL